MANIKKEVSAWLLILCGLGASSTAQTSPLKFYWSETADWGVTANNAGVVKSANFDGSEAALIAGGYNRIDDVELDSANSQLYWSNWASGPVNANANEGIWRSNLDGTAQTQIVGSASGTTSSTGHASGMHGIAIDPNANGGTGELYFTRGVSYADSGSGPEVSKVNLDGTGVVTKLNGVNDGWFLNGIDLDAGADVIYYGSPGVLNIGTGGAVNSVQTDGIALTYNLVPHTNGLGRAIALDAAEDLLFFSSWEIQKPNLGGSIWSLDLSTNIANEIFTSTLGGILDLELDTLLNTIYFTEFGTTGSCGVQVPCTTSNGTISSIGYGGGGYTTHIGGLTNPFGLALAFEESQSVPEPGSLTLMAISLAGVGFSRRKTA
jgi:hypothetical protein